MTDTILLEIEYKLNLDTPELYHKQKILEALESLWFVQRIEEKGDTEC